MLRYHLELFGRTKYLRDVKVSLVGILITVKGYWLFGWIEDFGLELRFVGTALYMLYIHPQIVFDTARKD